MIERLLEHGDVWPGTNEPTPQQRPRLIVVHAMAYQIDYEGERLYAASYLDRVGLSAHILVAPDGTLIRCRPDDRLAWHAKGFNQDSLGIEFLVPGVYEYGSFTQRIAEPWTAQEQLDEGADQIRQWCADWPIERITGHCWIDPERKPDPGRGFRWDRLMARLANPEQAA